MSSNQYVNKPGSGAAFFQSNKRNDRQPDWTGEFEWNGEKLQLAMWERKSKKNGLPFLAFQIGPKFVPGQNRQPQPEPIHPPTKGDEPDDSIPF